MPYECNAGGCGSCKYQLIEGNVSSDIESPQGLRRSDVKKGIYLACVTRPMGDCVVSARLDCTYEPSIRPKKVNAELVSRLPLTHDLWEFSFKSDCEADFLPGQYAKIFVPGVNGPRSYSMSNTANCDGVWEFQIKKTPDGAATSVLFGEDLEGMTCVIDAPYSIAHLDMSSPRPVICIAGGSGLAPMVSILRGLSEQPERISEARLYYGARTADDIVKSEYFASIPGFVAEHQYVPVVSEPDSSVASAQPTGFIHDYLSTELPEESTVFDYYLAGPPPMVDAVRRHLVLDRKVPIEHLHYDRFY